MAGLLDHQPTRTYARAAGANSRHVRGGALFDLSFVSELFFFRTELYFVYPEVAVRAVLIGELFLS